ncbi:MAG TPA: CDP-glucose 4,6-dehydratase [Azospirillaceae bacterium]|nr:CDP-glucose 4,6-dehydratase [Azospirillaceae bacterium]
MTPSFWQGRRVLVTGHTGFKGAWLCLMLERMGARVAGLALEPDQEPSLFALARPDLVLGHHAGDIRDAALVARTVAAVKPDIVLHLAAQSLVRLSYADPLATYATNVMGTAHVLEAVRALPSVQAVVVVSSDKCYENREWIWGYREADPMGGHDPYSSSKGCTEIVASSWRRSYFHDPAGTKIGSGRAGNVIGGGDWARDRLVPDTMRAFAAGRPVTLRNPNAVRPWQHVLEPLSGYLLLAERMAAEGQAFATGWNFGPADEDAQRVVTVARRLGELWGEGARVDVATDADLHEAQSLRLDCTKAKLELGWRPILSLDEALAWTSQWYRSHRDGADMRAVTLDQIARFNERVSR